MASVKVIQNFRVAPSLLESGTSVASMPLRAPRKPSVTNSEDIQHPSTPLADCTPHPLEQPLFVLQAPLFLSPSISSSSTKTNTYFMPPT